MTSTRTVAAWLATFGLLLFSVLAQDYTCSPTKPCAIGCCSNGGVCGLGPVFCAAENCTSSCGYKSECDPGWGIQWSNASTCPLNVCCSAFGFCGSTADFCGDTKVPEPSCSGNSATNGRVIGYYEGWNLERSCNTMAPEDVTLGYWTHINFAFAYIDPGTFEIAPMSNDVAALYQRVSALKQKQNGLEVWISVGGWSFNDPGATATTFSNLARSTSAQSAFFKSLISFLVNNNFDGVDLDWEYPVAPDRFGSPDDFVNFVSFLKNLRAAFDNAGLSHRFGISLTLPSSYWYLQGFDIAGMEPIIDWFNVMTYDLHGTWDSSVKSIGNIVQAHTNLTEINLALQLLWRNNIDPAKVNMGLGFYGRSFTLTDPSCSATGCPFSAGGNAGPCTATAGILSSVEIGDVISAGATVTLDKDAAVKIVTWGGNQWVSYDDGETMKTKLQYANSKCLGGTLVWAMDLDNGTMIGYMGKTSNFSKKVVTGDYSGLWFY
ncbi:hypothetical protein VF21_07849 [Pseudogymnoascus sp. 05NY08]|nr:hypothetical protein VF21_07849 [Pseudogymnoascus sp. 05NY08]